MGPDVSHDAAMLRRVRAGDPAAFEDVIRKYHPELFRFALRWLKHRDDAEDLLQDVMLSIWRHYDTIATDIPLRPYLYRAVRNALLNARRSRARSQFLHTSDVAPESIPDPQNMHCALEHEELLTVIEHTVINLPERCREVWLLVRERGLSYQEAAQVLGIAPGTVHVQMSRAFGAIRKAVEVMLAGLVVWSS